MVNWHQQINLFLNNFSICTLKKQQRTFGFQMFSGGIKRNISMEWVNKWNAFGILLLPVQKIIIYFEYTSNDIWIF